MTKALHSFSTWQFSQHCPWAHWDPAVSRHVDASQQALLHSYNERKYISLCEVNSVGILLDKCINSLMFKLQFQLFFYRESPKNENFGWTRLSVTSEVPQSHSSPASSMASPQRGPKAMLLTEPEPGSSKQLGWARSMNSSSCLKLQLLKNSGNSPFLILHTESRTVRSCLLRRFSQKHDQTELKNPRGYWNSYFSVITQSVLLSSEPHRHPSSSWDKPKLCPISWAMVEARPIRFSWWS